LKKTHPQPNYVDIDSEEEMLGYGIGMYFVAPAAAIVVIKRKFF